MAEFKHGITIEESEVRVSPANIGDNVALLAFGTAPVNTLDVAIVNEPIIAWDYDEAVAQLGYSKDFAKYTLCEVIKSYLGDYKQAPVVFVNVLDPTKHKTAVPETEKTLVNKQVIIEEGVIKKSVTVKNATTPLVLNTDYLLSYNTDGKLLITATAAGAMAALTTVKVAYDKINPEAVTKEDIIGGIDATTGIRTGLELIEEVFPKYKVIPNLIIAPKFSRDADVGATMNLKAEKINGNFKAMPILDLEANSRVISSVPTAKLAKGFTSQREIVCWPMSKKDGLPLHKSTVLAGTIAKLDYSNNGIPFVSPSNKTLLEDSTIMDDGTEIRITVNDATALNRSGIVTSVDFIGGMRSWGNHSAYYQSVSEGEGVEPKEVFIAVRRMIDWVSNTIILKCWDKVDDPSNKRLVSWFISEINVWLNSLKAIGALLGGRIEFFDTDNPTANLMDGKLKFRVYVTPPVPAGEVIFVLEYDPNSLSTLFA